MYLPKIQTLETDFENLEVSNFSQFALPSPLNTQFFGTSRVTFTPNLTLTYLTLPNFTLYLTDRPCSSITIKCVPLPFVRLFAIEKPNVSQSSMKFLPSALKTVSFDLLITPLNSIKTSIYHRLLYHVVVVECIKLIYY